MRSIEGLSLLSWNFSFIIATVYGYGLELGTRQTKTSCIVYIDANTLTLS